MTAAPQASYPVGKLLVLVALVCFVLAAFGVTVHPVDLGWLGLAFLAGGMLV